jgi:hypothetical protein
LLIKQTNAKERQSEIRAALMVINKSQQMRPHQMRLACCGQNLLIRRAIMTDNPNPLPPEPSPKKPRAAQDQADANLINTYRTRLTTIAGQTEAVGRLTPRGYDLNGLGEGIAACDLAQAKFNARQLAMDEKSAASKALKKADKAARDGYADFSKIAAKVFKDNATAKAAVVIPSRQIVDQEKFLTNVEAAYTAAMTRVTYQAALSKRGYTAEALQAEQAKLKALTQASAAHEAAQQAATRATAERVAAMKALNAWWSEFNTTAQVALKDRSDLSGLLSA